MAATNRQAGAFYTPPQLTAALTRRIYHPAAGTGSAFVRVVPK